MSQRLARWTTRTEPQHRSPRGKKRRVVSIFRGPCLSKEANSESNYEVKNKMSKCHSTRRRRRGTAAVEMALIAPLLIMLLAGIWEIGRMVEVHQLLTNACREAGRQAATGKLTAAEVQQVVIDYLESANISTEGMPTPLVENRTNPKRTNPAEAEQLDYFRITASLPVANIKYSAWHFFSSPDSTITSSVGWNSMRDLELTISTTIPVL